MIAQVEKRDRRVTAGAFVALLVGVPTVRACCGWACAVVFAVLVVRAAAKLHTGEREIGRLRCIMRSHRVVVAETQSPHAVLAVIGGIGRSIVAVPMLLALALFAFAIPCVGWLFGVMFLLAVPAHPFVAICEALRVRKVRCPRCSQLYHTKRGEEGDCVNCPARFIWIPGNRSSVAIYSVRGVSGGAESNGRS